MSKLKKNFKIALVSVHGLIRSENLELGRDADTGGQIRYVVELAKALGKHPDVEQVKLITRQVLDPKVDPDYGKIEEKINDNVTIIRIPFGPKRYLRKEKLWPFLDSFIDQTIAYFKRKRYMPDVIHGHYADAGYAAGQIARLLGIPYIFTGHSLGRVKKDRMSSKQFSPKQQSPEVLEAKYNFNTRIEAEEFALETASLVVTSTVQEIEEQYQLYDHYQPSRQEVIPPGVDLRQFQPPTDADINPEVVKYISHFLDNPKKPIILAMARPDEKKNFETLIRAYGESSDLQNLANLVLIAGNRDDLRELERPHQRVLINILTLIDKYNLYGKVAYPKTHAPEDVPSIYRFAAKTKGVFVNPAFTEPFGLTLLEAAASGLPIIATNDGGPRDIIAACENGVLINPLNVEEISGAILQILINKQKWKGYSTNGINGSKKHYSWRTHVNRYIRNVHELVAESKSHHISFTRKKNRLLNIDRMIITDVDGTLTGDNESLDQFRLLLNQMDERVGFGIATGRTFETALEELEKLQLPRPDLIISSVGTQINYGDNLVFDKVWPKQIVYQWKREDICRVLGTVPGLIYQEEDCQSPLKISYEVDTSVAPAIPKIRKILRAEGLRAKVVFSLGMFLDIIPIRADDGLAIRYLALKWGISPDHLLVAGDSGNDEPMLKGNTLGVVVGNYSSELNKLRNRSRIYFAQGAHAAGIIEGINYYNFLENITINNDQINE